MVKVKVKEMCICIAPRREHTSKVVVVECGKSARYDVRPMFQMAVVLCYWSHQLVTHLTGNLYQD